MGVSTVAGDGGEADPGAPDPDARDPDAVVDSRFSKMAREKSRDRHVSTMLSSIQSGFHLPILSRRALFSANNSLT